MKWIAQIIPLWVYRIHPVGCNTIRHTQFHPRKVLNLSQNYGPQFHLTYVRVHRSNVIISHDMIDKCQTSPTQLRIISIFFVENFKYRGTVKLSISVVIGFVIRRLNPRLKYIKQHCDPPLVGSYPLIIPLFRCVISDSIKQLSYFDVFTITDCSSDKYLFSREDFSSNLPLIIFYDLIPYTSNIKS